MKKKTEHQVESDKRLRRIAEKKFKTTMIFPIAEFERAFGHIWADGKDTHDLTKEQMSHRALWQRIRSDILDNGNKQMRALLKELNSHTVEFNGYETELVERKG